MFQFEDEKRFSELSPRRLQKMLCSNHSNNLSRGKITGINSVKDAYEKKNLNKSSYKNMMITDHDKQLVLQTNNYNNKLLTADYTYNQNLEKIQGFGGEKNLHKKSV